MRLVKATAEVPRRNLQFKDREGSRNFINVVLQISYVLLRQTQCNFILVLIVLKPQATSKFRTRQNCASMTAVASVASVTPPARPPLRP